MNRKSVARLGCVAVVALSIGGCSKPQVGFLSNAGESPLRVRYILPKVVLEKDQPAVCPRKDPVRMVATADALNRTFTRKDVPVPDYNMDMSACEVSFTLPPAYTAMVFFHRSCEDYEKRLERLSRNPAFRPEQLIPIFELFSVDNGSSRAEWRGWDAVKQFKPVRDGHCHYSFPA